MKTFPKLERLTVTNFQSLANADIELGAFTVIVGPSNSGKSALLRALRAVVRNVNSPAAVRVGKKLFTSEVYFDGKTVSIERGKSSSTYRIEMPDGSEEVYTKAGRDVPDDVQAILGLAKPDGTPDLVFTSQIDPPFLLDETGSTAAKVLGDLTNVSKLHAAAREANRRRGEASKMEGIRRSDALSAHTRMKEEFSDLPAQVAAVKECKALLEDVRSNAKQGEQIARWLEVVQISESAEAQLTAQIADLPKPADIEALAEDAGRLIGTRHRILDHLEVLRKCAEASDQIESLVFDADQEIIRLDDQYMQVLSAAGTCPTCGKAVHG